jgi:hypothetical protein
MPQVLGAQVARNRELFVTQLAPARLSIPRKPLPRLCARCAFGVFAQKVACSDRGACVL